MSVTAISRANRSRRRGRLLSFGLYCLSSAIALSCASLVVTTAAGAVAYDQAPLDLEGLQKLWLKDLPRATPDEPLLASYSEERAVAFLDHTALEWTRQNRCGTCHTTIPYLMVRPLLDRPNVAVWHEVRSSVSDFASERIAQHAEDADFIAGSTVAALAVGDAAGAHSMQPDTRALFDYLWTSQRNDGAWVVPREGLLPFLERDPRYLAFLVALGLGYVPEHYYQDDVRARAGFSRLRRFIRAHLPTNVHDKAVLLWASIRTPGLLSGREQRAYTRAILALQREDGGWALPSMGAWPRHDGAPGDPDVSDGYATGLAALVLCQRGYDSTDVAVQRAVSWIQRHQRASGRWYTRSLYSDHFQNYLSNMGTAYAVMALRGCGRKSP